MKRIIKRIIVGAITCGFVLAGFSPITAKADGTDPMDGWTIDGSKMISPAIEVTPEDDSLVYDGIAMDIYLDKLDTSDRLPFQLVSDPNSESPDISSYFLSIDPNEYSEVVTTSDGNTLYKYPLLFSLNSDLKYYGVELFTEGTYPDKVYLIFNNTPNYDGNITYDNVRYVDAENLDDIDTERIFLLHTAYVLLSIYQKVSTQIQYTMAAKAYINPLMTDELLDELLTPFRMSVGDFIDPLDIENLTYKELAALLTKLETDYPSTYNNVQEKIYDKGSKFITDFVADLEEGDVSQDSLENLLIDYIVLNEDMLLDGDESGFSDYGPFIEKLKALGVTDEMIANVVDPVTKTLLDKVETLTESNEKIEEEIAEVQEQLEEKQQAIEDKDKEIGEKSSEIDKLKKENEKNAADVAELEKKLKELEDEKAKTDAKIAEQEALVKKLQDEAASKTEPEKKTDTDDKKSENTGFTLKTGDEFVVGNGIYKITAADEVTLVSPKNDSLKSFVIEDTVKLIDGKDYKVTAIEANAFKENVKLTKVSIGANVAKIGKNAFNKCKKLKTITVKTELLTTKNVGANSFKGIKKKASFKVPKSKKKDYKKLFIKKGAKKPKVK